MAIFLPTDGCHTGFLRASIEIAEAIGAELRWWVSGEWLKDRPSKIDFYSRFLNEEADHGSFRWEKCVYEDSFPALLRSFQSGHDYVALLKEGNVRTFVRTALKEAPCPVLAIPGHFDREIRNIVLACIGGRFNEKALGLAALLGKRGRSPVEVVTVGSASSPALRMAQARAEYLFHRLKVRARYRILCGEPRQTLQAACRESSADMLIMGSSETHHWRDHRFRALCDTIAEEAACPVLVVK
ncbi:MAG: universal stress protein [Candidatus Omnitrophica bacterium]|nr:universal stress protein [Candidatus Omnitrophota bacterium]